MRDRWIDSALNYTAVKMNAIDEASDVRSKLMDLKRNGISQFTIDKFGEIITGTLDIPRVNNLEETITALSAAGLSKVDVIAPNLAALQANTTSPDDSIGLVYADPILNNNDWYISTSGTWTATGLIPALAEQLTPRKAVNRTFYVTMNGNDNDANEYIAQTDSDGMSIYKPFQTVPAALAAAANTGVPCVIIVHPGEYEIPPETEIPENCCLYGYDLRVTKLKIAEGFEENNMFLVNSGIKVRGFTITGLRHEAEWLETFEGSLDFGPPTKGYAFAFKPGVFITRSPYIADCTVLHDLTYQEMSLPQDRENGNPLMPQTGGCLYADGAVCDPDSPLRSVVVDSFTAVNPNGVGYAVVNNAIVQLVSVFTNWSRVGEWAHRGGQITIVNSNMTFGDFAFAATGFRFVVKIDPVDEQLFVPNNAAPNVGDFIRENVDDIVEFLMNDPAGYASLPNFTTNILDVPELRELTERDTRTIVLETADDVKTAQDTGTRFWIKGLFSAAANTDVDWQADNVKVYDPALEPFFLASFGRINSYLQEVSGTVVNGESSANTLIDAMFTKAIDVVENTEDYIEVFRSTIEAASHQFSYAGTGVNYNALPFAQRATGTVPDPATNLYQSNGGVIYATFSTEAGDTYLGTDLRVDFERNTIEGQAFSRGVQNITLPLIIGIGG